MWNLLGWCDVCKLASLSWNPHGLMRNPHGQHRIRTDWHRIRVVCADSMLSARIRVKHLGECKVLQLGSFCENEPSHSFSGVVGGGGGQEEVNLLKMSASARFLGLWVLVVARERSYPWKRVWQLVFGGCDCQGDVNLLKMSCSTHFRGLWVVVVARGWSYPLKTSHCTHFLGWWVVVVSKERLYPQKQVPQLVFGGCGWWWLPGGGQPPKNIQTYNDLLV